MTMSERGEGGGLKLKRGPNGQFDRGFKFDPIWVSIGQIPINSDRIG